MAAKTWATTADAGQLIRRARERNALTQDQVAEALNVDKSYISKLESGIYHAGRSKYFPGLARVLRLTPEEIGALNPAAVIDRPEFTVYSRFPPDEARAIHAWHNVVENEKFQGEVQGPMAKQVTPTRYQVAGGIGPHTVVVNVESSIDRYADETWDPPTPPRNLHHIAVRRLSVTADVFQSEDNILGYEGVPADEYRPEMLTVQLDDDSMEPTLPRGSRAYVDIHDTTLQDGRLYLVDHPAIGLGIKRVRQAGSIWLLMSDNHRYPPLNAEESTVLGTLYFVRPRGWRL